MMRKLVEEAEKLNPPIKERMLRVLKKELGIESIRITEGNNGNGGWIWKLDKEDS